MYYHLLSFPTTTPLSLVSELLFFLSLPTTDVETFSSESDFLHFVSKAEICGHSNSLQQKVLGSSLVQIKIKFFTYLNFVLNNFIIPEKHSCQRKVTSEVHSKVRGTIE